MLRCTLIVVFCFVAGFGSAAVAYTPESPEVRAAVERGAKYLETATDVRLGAKTLAGRAMIYLGKPEHPLIEAALTAVRRELETAKEPDESNVYSLGLAIAFVAELDDAKYRTELRGLVERLLKRRGPHGVWGYTGRGTGDTSMTQYALYGLWNAAKAGIAVDDGVWNDAVGWLLTTQDPGGGWGYQGNRNPDGARVVQGEVRRTMTEGALASLYLAGDQFGLWSFGGEKKAVSPLLKPVDGIERSRVVRRPTFDKGAFQSAIEAGLKWDAAAPQEVYHAFPLYHIYTIERFNSFRNAAEQRADDAKWYDEGVDYLLKLQMPDGSWTAQEGGMAGTSFAVLFLLRTTRASLIRQEGLATGTLVGGRGVPTPVKVGGAAAAVDPTAPSAKPGDALAAIEKKLSDPKFLAALSGIERVGPKADAPPTPQWKQTLVERAGAASVEAQAEYLKRFGRGDKLDDVPLAIEALADPAPEIYQAAAEALRFLARRTEELGKPLPADVALRRLEQNQWRQWYRTVRPVQ